ncbi:ABC transporter permease [Variovorax sp. V15]|uniref:ABC transporter permease n=1 Tax=Variovorax sp. V15 TaxID=3065952 RepID=UPI0034E8E812
MSLFSVLGALELGLIFSLVALAVLLSFRILNFPDLTVDGSFTTGGAVAAIMIVKGFDPFLATGCGAAVGAAAGFITAWLTVRMNIMNLLASILTMIGLYSINLRIMGKPNIPLINDATVFSVLSPAWMPDYWVRPCVLVAFVLLLKIMIDWYLNSQQGLALRATGINPRMARSVGVNTGRGTLVGISISNAFAALAGALFAQTQGGADISMGFGTIVVGLAAVIVGETVLSARRMVWITFSAIVGAILYRFAVATALVSDFIGLQAQDLSLVTAVLVALALILPGLRKKILARRQRAGAMHVARQ